MKKIILFGSFLFAFICAYSQIQLLNDEFDDASTLTNWLNIDDVEGWNADHLEAHDINTSQAGKLMMMPYTSSWYQDYRGTILFKEITGDFIITTEATATNRSGTGFPSSAYSLAGLMIRTPRNITNGAADWTSGGENYVFLATGHATGSSSLAHLEIKTTINGNSTLAVNQIPSASNVRIRFARIGGFVICLYQLPGGDWTVHRRFYRNDFPSTMQIGFVTYTDWNKVNSYAPIFQNSNVINSNLNPDPSSNPSLPFTPDLIGGFEFARFDDVNLPPDLIGVNLLSNAVTNQQLLSFLGFTSQPYAQAFVEVQANVLLSGPLDPVSQLMSDDLRTASLLPNNQPYNTAPWNYEGTEQAGAGVLNTASNDAIVDWILVELRDHLNPQNILATKAALLQRDGDVVDAQDGISPLRFDNVSDGNYFVSVRHRNHLGCMTAAPVALSSSASIIDFTTSPVYGVNAQAPLGSIQALWPGDVTSNGTIDAGDRSSTWNNRNQSGYLYSDCTMDGYCDSADRSTTWNNQNRTAQLP